MADYSTTLERIANSLEDAVRQSAAAGPDPWILLLAGAIAGAALGALGRWFIWDRQQKVLVREKRELFSGLLGDEISLRWRNMIGKDLRELFKPNFSMNNAQSFCEHMTISNDDLPIFKMAYDNNLELNVFLNKTLLSHIIYVHVLMRDLCHAQLHLKELNETYRKSQTDEDRRKIKIVMQQNWSDIKSSIIDEIYRQSDYIYGEIKKDYQTFLKERRITADTGTESRRVDANEGVPSVD